MNLAHGLGNDPGPVGPIKIVGSEALEVPLVDIEGPIANDATYLRGFLGLSEPLIDDLLAWADAWRVPRSMDAQIAEVSRIDLTARLREDLHGRYEVAD